MILLLFHKKCSRQVISAPTLPLSFISCLWLVLCWLQELWVIWTPVFEKRHRRELKEGLESYSSWQQTIITHSLTFFFLFHELSLVLYLPWLRIQGMIWEMKDKKTLKERQWKAALCRVIWCQSSCFFSREHLMRPQIENENHYCH
jgi:hypothetical protein